MCNTELYMLKTLRAKIQAEQADVNTRRVDSQQANSGLTEKSKGYLEGSYAAMSTILDDLKNLIAAVETDNKK